MKQLKQVSKVATPAQVKRQCEQAIKILKRAGYTVYAWKEGQEEIPEGLTNYVEALASKMAADEMEKFLEKEKRRDFERSNTANVFGPLSGFPGSKFQIAGKITTDLRTLEPSDQYQVIKWVTESLRAETDDRISKVWQDKARLDNEMKAADRYLLILTNAQDQLNEQ